MDMIPHAYPHQEWPINGAITVQCCSEARCVSCSMLMCCQVSYRFHVSTEQLQLHCSACPLSLPPLVQLLISPVVCLPLLVCVYLMLLRHLFTSLIQHLLFLGRSAQELGSVAVAEQQVSMSPFE